MGVLLVIVIIAALLGGVFLNHQTKSAALAGVEFHLPVSSSQARSALNAAYVNGAKATVRNFAGGLRVSALGDGLRYETKHGDFGLLTVRASGSGSIVSASAQTLFIGNTSGKNFRGIWAAGAALSHGLMVLFGVSPTAVRYKRFQNGLESRLTKELRKIERRTP